jgi:hypothetical protein
MTIVLRAHRTSMAVVRSAARAPMPPRARAARRVALWILVAMACAIPGRAAAVPDGLLANPATIQSVGLEDFSAYPIGAFPSAWQVRGNRDEAVAVYRVATEGTTRRFLSAHAAGHSVMIGLDHAFDPARFPYVRWDWRVRRHPAGGDERNGATNDSAAGVYVIFPGRLPFVPRVLKYVWSAQAPIGTRGASPGYDSTKIIVVDSGAIGGDAGWRTVAVNVRDDYAALFGTPAPVARGIGVLTDANDTASAAAADYAAFQLLAAAPLTVDTRAPESTATAPLVH